MSRTRAIAVAVTAVTVVVAAVVAVAVVRFVQDDTRRHYLGSSGWPVHGEGAYVIGAGMMRAGPAQRPVPIASVAKVMTALLVLRAAPLRPREPGFSMQISTADVGDTAARKQNDESVLTVESGEVLTERQALAALLLPSANNIAIMLARRTAGSVAAFVARMNDEAHALGMRNTHYTDPSGLSATTTSTAADQLRLAIVAMRNPTLRGVVRMPRYPMPVVGHVTNTDTLLGSHGFVGIKTGSDDAAGGCFMFRSDRSVAGHRVVITGVVLGQDGHNLITAGLYAGLQLADHAAATVAMRQTAGRETVLPDRPARRGSAGERCCSGHPSIRPAGVAVGRSGGLRLRGRTDAPGAAPACRADREHGQGNDRRGHAQRGSDDPAGRLPHVGHPC